MISPVPSGGAVQLSVTEDLRSLLVWVTADYIKNWDHVVKFYVAYRVDQLHTSAGVHELSAWSFPLSVNTPTGEPSATVLACTRNPRNPSLPDPTSRVTVQHNHMNILNVLHVLLHNAHTIDNIVNMFQNKSETNCLLIFLNQINGQVHFVLLVVQEAC